MTYVAIYITYFEEGNDALLRDSIKKAKGAS